MTGVARYLADPAFAATSIGVIDFEGTTPTGFPPEPIEVGTIILRPGQGRLECVARYAQLIRPPAHAPVTVADTRQTGITAAMVADQPPAGAVLFDLDTLLTAPPYLAVAHHAPTEAGILRRYADVCPRLARSPMLDTVRLARVCYPELASHSLDALLTHPHITPAGRHRALVDAEVTAQVLIRILTDGHHRHRWSQLAQLRQLAGLPPPADSTDQPTLF